MTIITETEKKGRETVAETIAYVQMNGEHFLFVADKASAVKNWNCLAGILFGSTFLKLASFFGFASKILNFWRGNVIEVTNRSRYFTLDPQ